MSTLLCFKVALICFDSTLKGFESVFEDFDGTVLVIKSVKLMLIKKTLVVSMLLLAFSVVNYAQTAPQDKTVTVFGTKIRYLEAGDPAKPKVILLHGLGGNAENWTANIAVIAAGYHVIVPDQLGFGKSDKPLIKYRVGTYVDFLDRFMAELKIEKATLVGNSMGGWVSALTAIKYPNRVEKLVLADAAGILPPDGFNYDEIYQLNNSTRDEIRANMKRLFGNPAFQNNEALVDVFLTQRMTSGDGYTINSLIESIKRREDFLDARLGEIKKPTLIIWGKQDGIIPLADGEKFNKGINGSQLIVFDPCGHVPQLEKAADFNREVLKFLEAK